MDALAIAFFCIKLVTDSWLPVLAVLAGLVCCMLLKNMHPSGKRIILASTAGILVLWGSVAIFQRGNRLFFLTILSGEENWNVEFASSHIDAYWDTEEISECIESAVSGKMPFSNPEKEQLVLFLVRLLARKEMPDDQWIENHLKKSPNVRPTLYYEYGYAEGVRSFRESFPDWVENGISVYETYRYFREKENGIKQPFVPFPIKNLGRFETGEGVYPVWSVRNRSSATQRVHLRPTSAGLGWNPRFYCSGEDSLQMPNMLLFHRLSPDGDDAMIPPNSILWVQAEKDRFDFTGKFTNVVVLAVVGNETNNLAVCGEVRCSR